MKKLVLTAALAVAALGTTIATATAQTACPAAPAPTVVSGTITSNTTWTSDKIYLLSGFVYVDNNATLTIQPGTIIKGEKSTKGSLIIRQGAKIDARGTAAQPIVFTSNEPAGARARGDWGGVILLGKAPQNLPGTPNIEGGVVGVFGGTDAADNSGTLQYVRIEFPGIAFQPNSEINGLTLGGVGSGTTIDHIQVSYSGDDSYEWFGGTVNCKYLIALRGLDDEWDTDNGFAGNVQFGVALRDPAIADQSGSNGFESDNDANGTTNTPQTRAVFSNMSNFIAPLTAGTVLDPNYKRGMHLRRNTALSVFNSLSVGYPVGLLLDGTLSEGSAGSGALVLKNNIFAGYAANRKATVNSGSTFNVKQFLGTGNDTTSTVAALNLDANNGNLTAPNFQPLAGSPLNAGAAFTDAKLASTFFDRVSYRGAVAPVGTTGSLTTNWTTGWTAFDPQNFCYNRPGVVTAARVSAEQSLQLGVYPNPTAGAARLSFALPQATAVTVRVVDATGRLVAVVTNGQPLAKGTQLLNLPANLPVGLYVVTISTSETTQSVRFVVAK